jgi:hypothetical protein
MLLHINGKFKMGKFKSSIFVVKFLSFGNRSISRSFNETIYEKLCMNLGFHNTRDREC